MSARAPADAPVDLESGSRPYSRSDSPSPERPLLDNSGHQNRGFQPYHDDVDESGDGYRLSYHDEEEAQNPEHIVDNERSTVSSSSLLSFDRAQNSHLHRRSRSARSSSFTLSIKKTKKYSSAVTRWIHGPDPPERHKINPILPNIQAIPLRILDNFCPSKKSKIIAWILASFVWLTAFTVIVHYSSFRDQATILGCNSSLWSKNSNCGLDGVNCRSFANNTYVFRCPSDCGAARLLEPYTVGGQQLNYQSLVVGGGLPSTGIDPDIRHYRADSFICLAAAHSGVLKSNQGGCARLRKTGMQPSFPSSTSNGVTSTPFDAPFVSSFTVEPLEEGSGCNDLRWTAFGVTLAFNILISLFTTDPTVFFWTLFCSIFWEVGLASDPPTHSTPYSLVAIATTRFLPTAFAAYAMERFVVRRTLKGLNAQIEKTVLWVGACWFGALNNYTFDRWIPISRLTPHDLNQQPGAKAALAVIIIVLTGIVISQALHIQKEGQMMRYLQFYLGVGIMLGLLIAIPHLNLRIHHYILSLLLLPGTRIQTRPSLIYQGLLLGLFINGLAKWGWDGLLQTGAELRGDALLGSALPKIDDVVVGLSNVTVTWNMPLEDPWDAVSVLVNDVERYRGQQGGITLDRRTIGSVMKESWWDNMGNGTPADPSLFENGEREKLYIRLGLVRGSSVGDYTKAGTVFPNGTWVVMEEGAS